MGEGHAQLGFAGFVAVFGADVGLAAFVGHTGSQLRHYGGSPS